MYTVYCIVYNVYYSLYNQQAHLITKRKAQIYPIPNSCPY